MPENVMTTMRRLVRLSSVVLVALFVAFASDLSSDEVSKQDATREAALKAIESRLGGVFVVTLQAQAPVRRSRVFEHRFTVEEVIKPYRSDEGTYYIPLAVNETTADRRSKLDVGKRYLIITRLQFGVYGHLELDAALEVSTESKEQLLQELRNVSKNRSAYGSSTFLEMYLNEPLDVLGVRTPHADGFVEPAAFGFSRGKLEDALRDGMMVLLVQMVKGRGPRLGPGELQCDIIEQLAPRSEDGKGGCTGVKREEVWVKDPGTYKELLECSKAMTKPYRAQKWVPYRLYIILVDERDGDPVQKAALPVIGKDDRTVRTIRSLLEEIQEK